MLTIFDCDGVLIDSEIISAEVLSAVLTAAGWAITPNEVSMRFAGLPEAETRALIADELGHAVTDDMRSEIEEQFSRRIAKVKAGPGVADMLDALDGPRCVCSNSPADYLRRTLTTAGLFDRFKPYVFSAQEVGNRRGKPDPNVFLHAASEFGVAPRDIVVVEDSVPGVRAAVAAGMRAVGFVGGAHDWQGLNDALTDAGAETVVRRAVDLAPTIAVFAEWGGLE